LGLINKKKNIQTNFKKIKESGRCWWDELERDGQQQQEDTAD
jgi:hypothetical protein